MFNSKRVTYYYDTDTCTYQKAEFNPKALLIKGLKRLGFSIVVFLALFVFFDNQILDMKHHKLLEEKAGYEGTLALKNQELNQFEGFLENLHEKDSELYSVITEIPSISETMWEGGRGGSEKFNKNNWDKLKKTQIKLEGLVVKTNLLSDKINDLSTNYNKKRVNFSRLPALRPIEGRMISGFGPRRHPINGKGHIHTGLDFACPTGTPVIASGDGVAVFAGRNGNGYGIHIDISHQNGYETKYAHLSKTLVKVGEMVKRGQLIGYSGNTGMSTGPHLHYEIKKNGVKINPIDYYHSDVTPIKYLKQIKKENQ